MENQTEWNDAAEIDNDDNTSDLFGDLYMSMVYLLALLIAGDLICGKVIKIVPPLVGQILMGIVFGPHGLDLISAYLVESWPLLGELGLVLMRCQAGLEMDFEVLQSVGPRGAFMALVGSILPTAVGFLLAYFGLGLSVEAALAVGCSFGPTSAGIALNVLQPCQVLKTPLGQLIVAIAIVDDIIALVVLSQLKALTAETISASSVAIPIVSALLWLFLGGVLALYFMPWFLQNLVTFETTILNKVSTSDSSTPITVGKSIKLSHIVVLLFALLPATYYSQASHLLGAFLAGLSLCQQDESAQIYNQELSKIITWLMRIFFGASIAFRIPVELFQDGQVIGTGFLLSLALLGKITTGLLLTPMSLQPDHNDGSAAAENSDSSPPRRSCYDRQHLRDSLVVGFSMAGEAEFAMLVAGFGYTEGLVTENIYASTIFAILLSTILSPCLLRLTLAVFPNDVESATYNANSKEGNNGERTGEEDEPSSMTVGDA